MSEHRRPLPSAVDSLVRPVRVALTALRRLLLRFGHIVLRPVSVRFYVRIVGIEVSQAIQYHRFHPSDPSRSSVLVNGAPQPSNSVRLVANKPTLVRVFVEQWKAGQPTPPVEGELSVRGRTGVIASANVGMAYSAGAAQRAGGYSLLFVLPPAWCDGVVDLSIAVFRRDHLGLRLDRWFPADVDSARVRFQRVGRLKVRGILVDYTWNGTNVPAPSGIDLATIMGEVLPVLPSPGVDYDLCLSIPYRREIENNNDSWKLLLAEVEKQRSASTEQDRLLVALVGLAPQDETIAGVAITGQLSTVVRAGDLGGSLVETAWALRHEIGHTLGLEHIRGSGEPPFEPYPDYQPYDVGSIGEYGFDARPGKTVVYLPAATGDIMTYRKPPLQWISPYTWEKLFDAILDIWGDGSHALFLPPTPMPRVRTVIVLAFAVSDDRSVTLESALIFDGIATAPGERSTDQHGTTDARLRVELLGEREQRLGVHRCASRACVVGGQDASRRYVERIEWSDEVRVVRLMDGEQESARWTVGTERPMVADVRVRRHEETIGHVSWTGSDGPDSAVHYTVRYSADAGQTWICVVPDTTETRAVIHLRALPGGEHCVVQVVANAAFRSTAALSVAFARPRRPRTAVIIEPREDSTMEPGQPFWLCGGGHSPDFGVPADGDISWTSATLGEIGRGTQVPVRGLPPGTHEILVRVADGLGGICTASRRVHVRRQREVGPASPSSVG